MTQISISAWCPGCEQRLDRCHCKLTGALSSDPAATRPACTRDVSNVPMRDQICPECGHWNGSHPIVGGSLKACVICQLVALVARLRVMVGED